MERKQTVGHLAALLTIVIWGTTFISSALLCHMEFCSKGAGSGKDKRIYLHGSCNNSRYVGSDFA